MAAGSTPNNRQHIYIDTHYVQEALWGKEKKFFEQELRVLGNDLRRNPELRVVIPQPVLGGIINNLCRAFTGSQQSETRRRIMGDLVELIDLLEADLVPVRREIPEVWFELLKGDSC